MSIAIIDVSGKPCPIPVIEVKKALAKPGSEGALVIADNIIAVQNLEKMAKGCGYGFSYCGNASGGYDITIDVIRDVTGDAIGDATGAVAGAVTGDATTADTWKRAVSSAPVPPKESQSETPPTGGLVVAIGQDAMGGGAEELGKILIKGFLYALSELPEAPGSVIFFNSGARLTSGGANTVEDLKKLEANGT